MNWDELARDAFELEVLVRDKLGSVPFEDLWERGVADEWVFFMAGEVLIFDTMDASSVENTLTMMGVPRRGYALSVAQERLFWGGSFEHEDREIGVDSLLHREDLPYGFVGNVGGPDAFRFSSAEVTNLNAGTGPTFVDKVRLAYNTGGPIDYRYLEEGENTSRFQPALFGFDTYQVPRVGMSSAEVILSNRAPCVRLAGPGWSAGPVFWGSPTFDRVVNNEVFYQTGSNLIFFACGPYDLQGHDPKTVLGWRPSIQAASTVDSQPPVDLLIMPPKQLSSFTINPSGVQQPYRGAEGTRGVVLVEFIRDVFIPRPAMAV